MTQDKASPQSPLAFFEHFLLYGGFETSLEQFYSDSEHLGNVIEIDKTNRFIKSLEPGEDGSTIEAIYTYSDQISVIIRSEFHEALEAIEHYISTEYSSDETTYAFLKLQVDKIQYIVNNSHGKIIQTIIIMKALRGILKRINEIYSPFKDKPFKLDERLLDAEPDISDTRTVVGGKPQIFHIKTNYDRISFFNGLADIAVRHSIIESSQEQVNAFIQVFTSRMGDNSTVRFICKNHLIIQFFENIKPIFQKFSAQMIEKSGVFYTKQDKSITQSNYNKTKSNFKDASILTDLKDDIEALLEKY